MSILKVLEAITATASTNAKLEIIKHNENMPFLSKVFQYAYNPRFNYYIKSTFADRPVVCGVKEIDDETFMVLDKLINRVVTGDAARQMIFDYMKTISSEAKDVMSRIINHDLRCGASDTMAMKVWKGLVPEYPYMRCSLPDKSNLDKITDEEWSLGVFSQLKHDGSYANVNVIDGTVEILSRNGSKYKPNSLGIDSLCVSLFADATQTHGELTVHENGVLLERQIGNGILNSILKGGTLADNQIVHYDVWDQIPLSAAVPSGEYIVPYNTRFELLINQLKDSATSVISIGEYKLVYSFEESQIHFKEIRARKLEGTIIKRQCTPWKDGTSKDQFKNKATIDVEMRVKGFTVGKGKHSAKFGALIVQSEDGLVEAGCSGFSDNLRKEINDNREDWLDAVITVTINGLQYSSKENKLHSVYLPRFAERRFDKSVADTLVQIEQQILSSN